METCHKMHAIKHIGVEHICGLPPDRPGYANSTPTCADYMEL